MAKLLLLMVALLGAVMIAVARPGYDFFDHHHGFGHGYGHHGYGHFHGFGHGFGHHGYGSHEGGYSGEGFGSFEDR